MIQLFNKNTIVYIDVIDESEESPIKIYKKGSWKKKPGIFSKGEKWTENVFELGWMFSCHKESTLLKKEGLKYKNNKLYRLSRIRMHFADQSSKTIYFNSNQERDIYLKNFDLTSYIKI